MVNIVFLEGSNIIKVGNSLLKTNEENFMLTDTLKRRKYSLKNKNKINTRKRELRLQKKMLSNDL